jgi:hypothetical protein
MSLLPLSTYGRGEEIQNGYSCGGLVMVPKYGGIQSSSMDEGKRCSLVSGSLGIAGRPKSGRNSMSSWKRKRKR